MDTTFLICLLLLTALAQATPLPLPTRQPEDGGPVVDTPGTLTLPLALINTPGVSGN